MSPSRSPHHPWNGRIPRQELVVNTRLDSSFLATTPRKPEHGASSYSVLSTQSATTPSKSAASTTARQALNTSTPVSSTLAMTPSSNWKKSKSVPPSGLSAGSSTTPMALSSHAAAALRLKKTPLRHSASISSALPATSGTPIVTKQLDGNGMTTPAPVNRAPVNRAPVNRAPVAHDGSSLLKMVAASPAPKKAPCNCKKSKCLKLYVDFVKLV